MYNQQDHDILKSVAETYTEMSNVEEAFGIPKVDPKKSNMVGDLIRGTGQGLVNTLTGKKNDAKNNPAAHRNKERLTGKDNFASDLIGGSVKGLQNTLTGTPNTKETNPAAFRNRDRMVGQDTGEKWDKENKAATTKTTPKPAPTATPKPTATAKPAAAQTGDKAKDMAAWGKANPTLAANKTERDRTRGTSSTTNPLMKSTFGDKHVSSMPKAAPKPAVSTAPKSTAPKPAVTPPKPVQPAKAVKPLKPVSTPKPPTLTKSSVSEAVELFEAAKKREPQGKTKTFKVNVIAKGSGGRTELIKAVNPSEARRIAASRFGNDRIGSVNTQARQYKD